MAKHQHRPTVLIHRQGRLGDTLVALPALRAVGRAFAGWNRVLLCDASPSTVMSMPYLLDGIDIHDEVVTYEAGKLDVWSALALIRNLRALNPQAVVFLGEWRPARSIWRDIVFFRLCGIRRIIGAPLSRQAQLKFDPVSGSWEAESHRLARLVQPLGTVDLDTAENWRMAIPDDVRQSVSDMLAPWPGAQDFIIVSAGAKVATKDWSNERWQQLIARLGAQYPRLGLAFTGGPDNRDQADTLAGYWPGPVLNCCGQSPKALAAMAERSRFMITTDGGPMHVAASVGTPTIALFSGFLPAGQWSPHGDNHIVLHQPVACSPCRQWTCPQPGHPCMSGIGVDDVLAACQRLLTSQQAEPT